MAAVHEDGEVGFEEGMLWLPSYVLNEAFDAQVHMRHSHRHQNHQRQHLRYREPQSQQHSKYGSRWYQRGKHGKGGAGMQAIFLESGQRSCGTGVFLPQRTGTNFQSTKKPACAPVLLPARVVQALNLNVQAIGLQVSPWQGLDPKYNPRKCEEAYTNTSKTRSEQRDAFKQRGAVSDDDQSSSPETFLPNEWTY